MKGKAARNVTTVLFDNRHHRLKENDKKEKKSILNVLKNNN